MKDEINWAKSLRFNNHRDPNSHNFKNLPGFLTSKQQALGILQNEINSKTIRKEDSEIFLDDYTDLQNKKKNKYQSNLRGVPEKRKKELMKTISQTTRRQSKQDELNFSNIES